MSDTESQTMTTKEAAALLGVSVQTIHRRIDAGELTPQNAANPALKRPRLIKLNRADVLALKAPRPEKNATEKGATEKGAPEKPAKPE